MHPLTKLMLECARFGAARCLPIAVVLNAEDGITVTELAEAFKSSSYSVKYAIREAVKRNWIRDTGEKRNRANVYRRTAAGQQLTERMEAWLK